MNEQEDKTKVIVLTRHYRITGEVALMQGARLTDYIAEAKQFIAVTNADVSDHEGRRLLVSSFLNVHRDHIEVILPADLATIDPTLHVPRNNK